MPSVIRVIAFANGQDCPVAGQYLEDFDFEAEKGRGYGTFTKDVKKAKQFYDFNAAYRFWTTISVTKPKREDGKPNRPLTATTVEILKVRDPMPEPIL